MPPTPLAMIFTATSSVASLFSASRSASALPCTSVLSRIGMMPSFCSSICANTSPIFEACFASFTSRNLPWRYSATSRALRSFSTARNSSPAFGEPCRPSTCTGIDGAALSTALPFSSNMARTRPNSLPAMIGSPSFSVPFFTSTVATAPRPFSTEDSMTMPVARPSAAAVSSSTSACSRMASSNCVDALAGLRRHLHEHVGAAPFFGDDFVLGELGAHAIRLGVGLVDLVDRDDDRHAGRLGVLDGFDGLRHDAVVGRDHEHHDVGGLGAARAHRGERRVARAYRGT